MNESSPTAPASARPAAAVPDDGADAPTKQAVEPESADDTFDFLTPAGPGLLGRLGHYRVVEVLGRGGMGVVFRAEDETLHRQVALKVMRPNVAREKAAARERFLREARATAQIEHDHIVTIYHVGEDQGVPYLAMQLLRGMSLEDWLCQGGRPTVRQAVRLVREAALGLAAAHARGLIHRDIKPANLFLENREPGTSSRPASGPAGDEATETGTRTATAVRVKLLDFGLARPADVETQITRQGAILGTPSYMSPEQARGLPVDARSDLFSLGCVLYRLCSGRLPFRGMDTMSVLLSLVNDPPRPIRELNADVPPALADLIGRLLAKDPNDRPASARAVADALHAIERELSGRSRGGAGTGVVAAAEAPRTRSKTDVAPPAEAPAPAEPHRLGRGLLLAGGGAVLVATLLGCLACGGIYALLPGPTAATGTVEVRADDGVRPRLEPAGVRARDEGTGEEFILALGPNALRPGKYAIVVASVPAGITFDPTRFDVAPQGPTAIVARAADPIVIPVAVPGKPPDKPPAGGQPAFTRAPFTAAQAKQHQDEWAAFLRREVAETTPAGLKLVLIPPGEFEMGSSEEAFQRHIDMGKHGKFVFPEHGGRRPSAEGPVHRARISRPFLLGACEVTVGQFRAFVAEAKYKPEAEQSGKGGTGFVEGGKKGFIVLPDKEVRDAKYGWDRPGFALSDLHPVSNVTLRDAQEFCRWLGSKEKKAYRLPTEAEWEYACRAGTLTAWSGGDQFGFKGNGGMWTAYNSKRTTHPVGQMPANPFGLFDMHGNVAEMCSDFFDPEYYRVAPADDPQGPPDAGKGTVVRGGAYHQSATQARSASRSSTTVMNPGAPSVQIGFRVVCEVPPVPAKQP